MGLYEKMKKPAVENSKKSSNPSGADARYYVLPENCTQLQDLIYYKQMGFSRGNIFKAAYRWDEKPDIVYNLEKILWFASYELEKLRPGRASDVVKNATGSEK